MLALGTSNICVLQKISHNLHHDYRISHCCFLQIDSSAIVEMEIIESDESDYEVDFSGEPPSATETGMCHFVEVTDRVEYYV